MKLLVQVRPIRRPPWWPKEDGGWVTLDPSEEGCGNWSAGRDTALVLVLAEGAKPCRRCGRWPRTVGDVLEGFLQDNNEGAHAFRVVVLDDEDDEDTGQDSRPGPQNGHQGASGAGGGTGGRRKRPVGTGRSGR